MDTNKFSTKLFLFIQSRQRLELKARWNKCGGSAAIFLGKNERRPIVYRMLLLELLQLSLDMRMVASSCELSVSSAFVRL